MHMTAKTMRSPTVAGSVMAGLKGVTAKKG